MLTVYIIFNLQVHLQDNFNVTVDPKFKCAFKNNSIHGEASKLIEFLHVFVLCDYHVSAR